MNKINKIPRRNYWKCRKHSRRKEEKCRRQQKNKPENARTEAKNLKKELLDVQKACRKEQKEKRAARNEMEKEGIVRSSESVGRSEKQNEMENTMDYAGNIKNTLLEVQEALEEENNGKWEAKRQSENMKKESPERM